MASFQKLWENAQERASGRDFWDDSSDQDFSSEILSVIRRGLEIRPDRADGETFWDDFLRLTGSNTSAVAKLLDVNPDVVSMWGGKVKKALEKVRSETDKKRADMLPTGQN